MNGGQPPKDCVGFNCRHLALDSVAQLHTTSMREKRTMTDTRALNSRSTVLWSARGRASLLLAIFATGAACSDTAGSSAGAAGVGVTPPSPAAMPPAAMA